MSSIRRLVALIIALVMTAMPVMAAQVDDPVEWPPGAWVAEFIIDGGIAETGQTIFLGGSMTMELSVDEAGAVVGGSVKTVGTGEFPGLRLENETTEPAPATLDLTLKFDMDLTGSSDLVIATGTWMFDGVFKSDEVEVPTSWEMPLSFPVIPDEASCVSVWGELLDTSLLEDQAVVTLSTRYLALPIGVGADDVELGDIVDEVQEASTALLNKNAPEADQILALVRLVQAATGEIVRAHLCDEIGQGAATSAHAWFEALLQDILLAVFATLEVQPDAYTTSELISLLHAGVSVGAVGASTANAATAILLLGRFESWLDVRADQANAAGDERELISIAVTAEQYGWQDLANKSYGYAAELAEG